MPRYEYKTVPAPRKGEKAKGVKGADGRLAQAMQSLLNTYGAEGWEYQRAETLPIEERSGIASKSLSYQSVLIFRRESEHAESSASAPAVATTEAPAAESTAPDSAEKPSEASSNETTSTDDMETPEALAEESAKRPAFEITGLRASRK